MNRVQEILAQAASGTGFDLQLVEDDDGLFVTTGIMTNKHNEQAEWTHLLPTNKAQTPAAAFQSLAQGLKAFCEHHGDSILFVDNPNNTELLTKDEQEAILHALGIEAAVKVNGA
jgi:hypothetical protein